MYSLDEDEIVVLPTPATTAVGAEEEDIQRIPDEDFVRDQARAAILLERRRQLTQEIHASIIASEKRDRTFGHGMSPEEVEAEREKEREYWRERTGRVPSWLRDKDEEEDLPEWISRRLQNES